MTNLARVSETDEKKEDCLDEIDKASQQLLKLIDDVLDVSSLEKNKTSLEHHEFSFNTMLNTLIESVQQYIKGKRQTLSFNIEPQIPNMLIGDEKRLMQITRNLLMNANKFTQEGGSIQLDASVVGEENGAVLIKIEISDNGIGIPEDKQATVFVTFEQVDGGLSRKFDGAGLGLAISKHLVEMMGGKIWVESKPGKGAKFSFTFKVENVQGVKLLRNSIVESKPNFKGKTALLVEDIKTNRDIVLAMLKDTQIQIDNAESGWQAIELFAAKPGRYDIILMNINMPVMNGWETARRIRNLGMPEGRSAKIIAMTAKSFQEDAQKNLAAGVDDHIGKPVDYNELLHKLHQYLA
jgi:CheY-like chemotaxis protein